MSRSILAHSNGIVCEDIGHRQLGKTRNTNRRTKIISEDEEGRSTSAEETVVGDAIADRAHRMLANTEPNIAPLRSRSGIIATVLEVVLGRSVEVG